MKVLVKRFDVAMEVKNKGVSLDVYAPDGEERLGDLQLTKTGLTWCNGKKHTGPKKSWREFIEWMNADA